MSSVNELLSGIRRGDVVGCGRLLSDTDLGVGVEELISAICVAAASGRVDMCAVVLDHARVLGAEADVLQARDEDGDTALCLAAARGYKDVCELLLDRGATHEPDTFGRTPLARAAASRKGGGGRRDVCALLLDRGATHAADNTGRTPLACAAWVGDADVCKLLLARGATHSATKGGVTPLSKAASRGHVDVCRVLLDGGATHDAAGEHVREVLKGASPLCVAAWAGHADVCKLLLERGAELTPCSNGMGPWDFARRHGWDAEAVPGLFV
jgi:ankyrin repeat protein